MELSVVILILMTTSVWTMTWPLLEGNADLNEWCGKVGSTSNLCRLERMCGCSNNLMPLPRARLSKWQCQHICRAIIVPIDSTTGNTHVLSQIHSWWIISDDPTLFEKRYVSFNWMSYVVAEKMVFQSCNQSKNKTFPCLRKALQKINRNMIKFFPPCPIYNLDLP